MASRNYYVVLGVPSTESGEGIRTAYRDLAKQLHPDHKPLLLFAKGQAVRLCKLVDEIL